MILIWKSDWGKILQKDFSARHLRLSATSLLLLFLPETP
ncbi:MAG: hypothetical protein UU12_C0014G0008 [Candidatus Woesebacteria bacterium GW2011_GWA2_40_7b]|uniref:Uncharacterized protein n=1 Tax=Candidatus Woesebacteria bacterium GW2011_GWA2_40_7b TaxID=1618563 RepID=A0A0G0T1I0_9BACT|nr:MAG: hypothetical protein UU12_C0014G0008 [Candidatus Woesebacteria bacterium GW2011_GWA2_40_7b]